ncbi:Hypothetical predicted protein, partial [Paramuricea clavata]
MLLRLRPNPANQQHLCLTKCIKDHLIFLDEWLIAASCRYEPENALSTEAVDVEMVFLTAIKEVEFGSLFGFVGRTIR